jgi:hypothetical protein
VWEVFEEMKEADIILTQKSLCSLVTFCGRSTRDITGLERAAGILEDFKKTQNQV